MNSIICQGCMGRRYSAVIPCDTGKNCPDCKGAGFHPVTCTTCLGRGSFPGQYKLKIDGLTTGTMLLDLTKPLPITIQGYKVSDGSVSKAWVLDLPTLFKTFLGNSYPLDTILVIHNHTAKDPRTWLKPITLLANHAGRTKDPTQDRIQKEASYVASRHFYNWLGHNSGEIEIRPRPSLSKLFGYLNRVADDTGFEIVAKQTSKGRFWTIWAGGEKIISADDYSEALFNACIILENKHNETK